MKVHTLFEIGWEVCNKVGGVHTVIASKAPTLVGELGDDYVAIGPWLLAGEEREPPFDPLPGYEAFEQACREDGIPVRVGRWRIPGRPLTVLVEFSGLFAGKDGILAGLWERFRVDSLAGDWDYVEPVMFGWAAGMVIERWWREYVAARSSRAVAQFHEWITASGLLYLEERVPAVGTVFTTHATVLGRPLASRGVQPLQALGNRTPEERAAEVGARAMHSLEGVAAREADVFTTVSQITAREVEVFHGRAADPILPGGIDLQAAQEGIADVPPEPAEAKVREVLGHFLGESVQDAALLALAGRYEFRNKGIDLALDALAAVGAREGRPVVLLVLVPAGNSGICADLLARLQGRAVPAGRAVGISTHNLFDPDRDPIRTRCRELGLHNAKGARAKVVHVPVYLAPGDGVFDMSYEAVLRAMDLTVVPSHYEPWGYTPLESLALGVPTITTDRTGFGQWTRHLGLGPDDGLHLLHRTERNDDESRADLAACIDRFVGAPRDRRATAESCMRTAERASWRLLIRNYEEAFAKAVQAAAARAGDRMPDLRPAARAVRGTRTATVDEPQLQRFEVKAALPPVLAGLRELARNLWWTWHEPARRLFEDLSPQGWERAKGNPLALLKQVYAADVEARARDRAYLQRLQRVMADFDEATGSPPSLTFGVEAGALETKRPVAYLCAEFGLHESLAIYSGGLGVLAADTLKSASDLGVPMVAVGLFYRKGYLRQRITPGGEQIAEEMANDPEDLPMEPVRDEGGAPLLVTLQLPSARLQLQVWRVMVGRVPLYLLDADLPQNRPEDRAVTHQLYRGEPENRLRQEIVLGRGAVRLLRQLGMDPAVYHLNEGHAAFAVLERVAGLVRQSGLTFDEARAYVLATTVFTTHTPIPAGHDRFPEDLIRRYFSDIDQWAGLPWDRFYAFGQGRDDGNAFNMTYLAGRFAAVINGVSRLHGRVSRGLLRPIWPMLLESEVPVSGITNGVHLPTWTGPELAAALGVGGRVLPEDFARAAELSDETLWQCRRESARRMMGVLRARLEKSLLERRESPALLAETLEALDPEALWIGFARRFAPYKRASLLFRDLERLAALVADEDRPVRFVFAGKAHPRDGEGLALFAKVIEMTRREELAGRVVFVPEYDLELGRALVRGVDVWLNNPLRPNEASGTSGMKVAANGGLNLSVADGWWVEGADGENGWTIGNGAEMPSRELQDEFDSNHLYGLLEDQVIPRFFDRDPSGLPREWLGMVRHSLVSIPTRFNTDRMVRDYGELGYAPLARAGAELRAGDFSVLRSRVAEHARVRRDFERIAISSVTVSDLDSLSVSSDITARVEVDLGPLQPEDVTVELVLQAGDDAAEDGAPLVVELARDSGEGSRHTYAGAHRLARSGSFAYGIRVRARQHDVADDALRDLVLWARPLPPPG